MTEGAYESNSERGPEIKLAEFESLIDQLTSACPDILKDNPEKTDEVLHILRLMRLVFETQEKFRDLILTDSIRNLSQQAKKYLGREK